MHIVFGECCVHVGLTGPQFLNFILVVVVVVIRLVVPCV